MLETNKHVTNAFSRIIITASALIMLSHRSDALLFGAMSRQHFYLFFFILVNSSLHVAKPQYSFPSTLTNILLYFIFIIFCKS